MPQQLQLADLTTGEAGKALIAGVVPAKTGYEDLAVAIRTRSDELLSTVADIRLLFALHDGYPNDADRARSLCLSLKGKVEVIGVLLDPDEGTQNAMREIFTRTDLSPARQDLPKKLAAMLERFVANYSGAERIVHAPPDLGCTVVDGRETMSTTHNDDPHHCRRQPEGRRRQDNYKPSVSAWPQPGGQACVVG